MAHAATGSKNTVMEQDWKQTLSLMKEKDPLAGKLLTWIYINETTVPVDTHTLMQFVRQNENWPGLHKFRDKIEKNISSTKLGPAEVTEYFSHNPPENFDGIRAYAQALLHLGRSSEATKALSAFWHEANLTKTQTSTLYASYKKHFRADDHVARTDHLIWSGRLQEAEYMLQLIDPDTRALAQARIALARSSSQAPALVLKVPARLQNDEGLTFERLRWRRRKDDDKGALALINSFPAKNISHPEAWWGELNILARRAIEEHNFKKAHDIISKHTLPEGSIDWTQAHWMLGWLELRFLKDPFSAYSKFEGLYRHVTSSISKSRAAYWAARAAEANGQTQLALDWYKLGAIFSSTFYGQLSAEKINIGKKLKIAPDIMPSAQTASAFEKKELVRALRLLHKTNLERLATPFVSKLLSQAEQKEDYYLIAKLSRDIGLMHYIVQANKDCQQKLGQSLFPIGYPVLSVSTPSRPERALIHAITYRESMFKEDVMSSAGARGLMQLMPATAKSVSQKEKRRYDMSKLTTDPAYNVFLGSSYLDSLIQKYDGYLPLAIAAYNAGPGNVAKWLDTFGNPAEKNPAEALDWIELIPIYETRNYVHRVMEAYYMYAQQFGTTPKTLHDFSKR